MIVGLHGMPPLDGCPTKLVRCGSPDGGADRTYAYLANYTRLAKERGIEVLPVFSWYMTNRGLTRWTKVIDSPWCEYGNEPGPSEDGAPIEEVWDSYRGRLRRASPILREAGKKVILAAAQTGHTNGWLDSTPDKVFDCVDGVAVHPYAETISGVLDILYLARQRIPNHLPIYLTEVGWGVGPVSIGRTDLTVDTNEQQAHRLTLLFDALRQHSVDLRMEVACWFCHHDLTNTLKFVGKWQEFCGVVRTDLTHKPSYAALAAEAAK